jgi:hypothetical protein
MPEATTKSAIDALQCLALHLDDAVEELIEAHSFAFVHMEASATEASAVFGQPPSWSLVLSNTAGGDLKVILTTLDGERPSVSLALAVATGGARSMAEATGLALSFVGLYRRLRSAA